MSQTQEQRNRQAELKAKEVAGTITPAERQELAELVQVAA